MSSQAGYLEAQTFLNSSPLDIEGLLQQARGSKCLLLTSKEFRLHEPTIPGAPSLYASLKALCDGTSSVEGFSAEVLSISREGNEFGHAAHWVDAGASYESILQMCESNGGVDYVFCLDPWVCQLLCRRPLNSATTRWILLSDTPEPKHKEEASYWERIGNWYLELPSYAILGREALLRVLNKNCGGTSEGRVTVVVQSHRSGAWQLRRLSSTPHSETHGETTLLILIEYGGSLVHLRVLLDSIVRQEFEKDRLRIFLVVGEAATDLITYLGWFRISHPAVMIEIVRESAGTWSAALKSYLGSPAIRLDEHYLLPERFCKFIVAAHDRNEDVVCVGIALSIEVSAHIVTMNLDPHANYEKLLEAFCGMGEGSRPGPAPISRLFMPDESKRRPAREKCRLLRLADHP